MLAGLVSITAGCHDFEPYFALITGIVGSLVYVSADKILEKLHIDDPIKAAQIHCFCGIWGTIAVGFFSNSNGLVVTGYSS